MDSYVIYNTEYKVLICRQHSYGLPPDRVSRHFRESHKSIPLPTRQAIVDHSKSLNMATPENVVTPSEPISPIEGLTIVNGFQCQYDYCSEQRGTEPSIKQHCWETHRWKAEAGVMWREQAVQTFFQGPHRK